MTEKINMTLSWIHYWQSEKTRERLFVPSSSTQQGPLYSLLRGAPLVSSLGSKST